VGKWAELRVLVLTNVDVKTFLRLLFWSRFLRFLYSRRFLFLENVGKVQRRKQINKKLFQNNSNEIDL